MALIERLRALKTLDVHWERLATEAAAEIERLQSLVLGLRERCRIQDGLISDNADLHDEIALLAAQIAKVYDEIERLECQLAISKGKHTNAIAEIERLRHEIDVQCSSEYVERILKENERLRAALERIARGCDLSNEAQAIAREALKDDPTVPCE